MYFLLFRIFEQLGLALKNRIDALDDLYTDHPCVDYYKQPRTKDILSIFQKGSVSGLDDYQVLYLICHNPICFAPPPSGVASHSLRSPGLGK